MVPWSVNAIACDPVLLAEFCLVFVVTDYIAKLSTTVSELTLEEKRRQRQCKKQFKKQIKLAHFKGKVITGKLFLKGSAQVGFFHVNQSGNLCDYCRACTGQHRGDFSKGVF